MRAIAGESSVAFAPEHAGMARTGTGAPGPATRCPLGLAALRTVTRLLQGCVHTSRARQFRSPAVGTPWTAEMPPSCTVVLFGVCKSSRLKRGKVVLYGCVKVDDPSEVTLMPSVVRLGANAPKLHR